MAKEWPSSLPVVQIRFARPTGQMDEVTAFYREGLGLPVIFSYEDDADYDGIMFGLPGRQYQLEITRHRGDRPCPAPPPDSLLVLYIPDQKARDILVERLAKMGYTPSAPRNTYWAEKGVTISDPDGWNVVLMNTSGFGDDVV